MSRYSSAGQGDVFVVAKIFLRQIDDTHSLRHRGLGLSCAIGKRRQAARGRASRSKGHVFTDAQWIPRVCLTFKALRTHCRNNRVQKPFA